MAWEELALPPPGNRVLLPAGRYLIVLEIPRIFRSQARYWIESWGYRIRALNQRGATTVADVELPTSDAVTVVDWIKRAAREVR